MGRAVHLGWTPRNGDRPFTLGGRWLWMEDGYYYDYDYDCDYDYDYDYDYYY